MSEIEKHMVKATKFKGEKYGDDRQAYLSKLLEAVDSLSRGAYEKLCDQLDEIEPDMANTMIDWLQEAVAAKENDKEIPELPDLEEQDDEPGGEVTETGSDDEEVVGDDEPSEELEPIEDDEADLEAAEAADAEAAEVDAHADEADGGDEEDGVGDSSVAEEDGGESIVPTPKGTTPGKKAKPKKAFKEVDYSKVTGEKDKYGIVIGTKTHEAIKMYEKGCTAAQLMETVGGRHYNILTRLINEGHKVQKLEGGVWKLTHKDAARSKKK